MLNQNLSDLDSGHQFKHDENFFESIYVEFYPGLVVFAKGYVKQISIAEDIVEDVFIKLWQSRSTIYAIRNLKLYLFVAIKNSCINHLVKQKKNNVSLIDDLDIDIEAVAASPEDCLITKERIALINAEIKKLPKKCQAIFILVKEEGLKYNEVAVLLDLSVKTIEAQMSIAFKKLAIAFAGEFSTPFIKTKQKRSI